MVLGNSVQMQETIDKDTAYTIAWVGESQAEKYNTQTVERFKHWFVETGVIDGSLYLSNPTEPLVETPNKQWEKVDSFISIEWETRITAFWGLMFTSLRRMLILYDTVPYLLILLIPPLIDGLVKRQIRKYHYGDGSPTVSVITQYILGGLSIAPLIYLFLPWPISPITILFWGAILGAMLFVFSSNLQKRI